MAAKVDTEKQIAVVGAGVIGLTSAIRLLEAGHSVDIHARDITPHTTSDVAASFWCPYRVGPHGRALEWARFTRDVFSREMKHPECGISLTRNREIFKEPAKDPWYLDLLQNYKKIPTEQLPEAFSDAYEFDTYLIETASYMKYLHEKVQSLGANIIEHDLHSLEELKGNYDVVINCSGVWARQLVNDESVYPIRGQVVVIEKLDKPNEPITTHDAGEYPSYIVPRSNDCLLGGTALADNWDLEAHPETASNIRARCEKIVPETESQKVLQHKVGLRPGRKSVRLELDQAITELPVIHNYGHGGSGYTLSWGCAEDVLELVGQVPDTAT